VTFAQIIEYVKKGIFTVLGLFLALYLFVILVTYSANDPSWSHISSDMTSINNMGGTTGAWLSDLFYVFLGWGAWWLFAFLVYETVLLWWERRPTFGLLRLVAYIFLLLAGSALFTQISALLQGATEGTAIAGKAGGIIGLELATRLALLMTTIGSLIFLLVFVLITMTFAFNIHWLELYQGLVGRAWLGSGVKANDDAISYDDERAAADEQIAADHDDNHDFDEDSLADDDHKHGQLPLRMRAPIVDEINKDSADSTDNSTASAPQTSGRASITNVLNDFLMKSGLGASLKEQLQAEQEEQEAATAANLANNIVTPNATDEPTSLEETPLQNTQDTKDNTPAPAAESVAPVIVKKVEPSFKWNNDETVSSLLNSNSSAASNVHAHDAPATQEQPEAADLTAASAITIVPAVASVVAATTATATTSTAPQTSVPQTPELSAQAEAAPVTPPTAAVAAEPAQAPTVNEVAEDLATTTETPTAVNVDALAESWLSSTETEVLAADWEADKPKPAIIDTLAPAALAATQIADSVATPTHTVANPEPQPIESTEAPVTARAAVMDEPVELNGFDMTPTNTPPANPKEPPTAIEPAAVAAPKPTVSFAVPENGASNHIEDMVPEDDVATLPAIEDDAAYAGSSRSMQTAKYRAGLTPIPELSILDKPDPDRKPSYTEAELEQLSELLEIKLQDFNVKAEVKNAIPGPVVTRFEVELAPGIKASKVTGISRDLARSLSMASLRVVEVIPGKPYIGIEVPNKKREMVRLIELLTTEKYQDPKAQISMAMGKDIGGNPIITDLARAPHMLVAGTTGSGKSVLVNSMLLSMLLKYKPSELRLILIDPKQLELANYNDIPHLLTPVVTDMTEAASSLSWCVAEMERRYQLMSLLKVRKLGEFNKKVIAAEKAGNPMIDPLWRPNDSVSISQAPKLKTLPMIVIVADEFADMIMQVGKQAEELITRLAQKSRAAGIHLMLATQRPSVDVITGLIKANIPVRAALRVNSKVDSRTILDAGGAEDMLGNGDMLFLGPGQIEPDRVHGAYVSDEEVNRVCDAWRERGAPDYIDNMASNFELSSPSDTSGNNSGEDDNLYDEAVAFVLETRKVSASSIQRKFSIGYNRAARIVDSMEEAGLVSSMGKSGKRELLM
jgi:S-DNA-T family DNA segregation ATPase FtsK/SpoIIIE